MISFLIYLFETGLSLSLLYLAYWLFLRKETYFNFNRIFLIFSLFLALSLPLLHLNFAIQQEGKLSETASGIMKFRHSYEVLIGMLDADFGAEPGQTLNQNSESREAGSIPGFGASELKRGGNNSGNKAQTVLQKRSISLTGILLIIYIGGVLYFFVRFVYLVIRLSLLAKRNGIANQDGFRIVEIEEDISPFSFFRFLFINSSFFNEQEIQNVLEHEKAHIMQRHSLDHLFAHGFAVFQWFNPFAWQMRKALKTTHEYIADRQVLNKGFELFDYQTILLKQVIGYHSVELVNNFNLKPIKNRIAMMTKKKSGLPALLKALLVLPMTIIAFLFFADFSLKGTNLNNLQTDNWLEIQTIQKNLEGLWVKETPDNNPVKILFVNNSISILTGSKVEKYTYKNDQEFIHFNNGNPGEKGMKYILKNGKLILLWNDKDETTYIRSKEKNSLNHFLSQSDIKINLPFLTQYRIMENESTISRVSMVLSSSQNLKMTLDGSSISATELEKKIQQKVSNLNKLDRPEFFIIYYVDKEVPMGELVKVREQLGLITRKFAEGGSPYGSDHTVSPLLFDKVALPRILPPPDAQYLEKKELEKMGLDVLEINLSERNTNPQELDKKIQAYISKYKGKYLISLVYDGAIPYGQYVETVDMIFNIVYKFRNELAMEQYGVSYGELGDALQKEVRKVYPVAMSEKLVKE